jgi:hypothetical protein
MNGQALILFLDAVVNDDGEMMRELIQRFPLMAKTKLSYEELRRICPPEKMCNHFYVQQDGSFGLVVEDIHTSRTLVSQCNIAAYIYWGPNSDPVPVATVAQVAEAMRTFEQHQTPTKVLAVLEAFRAAAKQEATDEVHA